VRIRPFQALGMRASLTAIVVALSFWPGLPASAQSVLTSVPASAQESGEAYAATAIASEGFTGDIAGRITIRIGSYTTTADKTDLIDAFRKNPQDGLALLRTMSKGYINIEGRPGRKIHAVFSREWQDGHELILISEHVVSKVEQARGIKAEDYPIAVMHLRFGGDRTPVAGEVFPAVKLAITPDGYLDVQTDDSNKIRLFNIVRR
jgi:hypothetical protein